MAEDIISYSHIAQNQYHICGTPRNTHQEINIQTFQIKSKHYFKIKLKIH